MASRKNKLISTIALLIGLGVNVPCGASIGASIGFGLVGGNVHYHGEGGPYYPPANRYYNRGGYYYGGGWGGPNVVINVPAPRYYVPVPVCENVEVCDGYGDCWLERYCD